MVGHEQAGGAFAGAERLEPGDRVPPFTLPDIDVLLVHVVEPVERLAGSFGGGRIGARG